MFLETVASLLPLALRAPHGPVLDAVHFATFLHVSARPAMTRSRRLEHEVVAGRLQVLWVKRVWRLQHAHRYIYHSLPLVHSRVTYMQSRK